MALTQSGPITAATGQTIEGLRISSSSGPCVYVPPGVRDVTITGCDIGPAGAGSPAIHLDGASNVTVRGNTIHEAASGMYAHSCSHPIVFERNTVRDVRGPMPRGQMVQFDKVTGSGGQSRIVDNVSDATSSTGPTKYEDHISVYMSKGTPTAPIIVARNRIRGGDSTSGSAIMVGDGGGSWIEVLDNIVVLVPNTGIGVAGGSNITVAGNAVYNAGATAASRTQTAIYVMGFGSTPTNVSVTGNRAVARAWLNGSGDEWGGYWTDGNAVNLTESGNVWQDGTLSESLWIDTPVDPPADPPVDPPAGNTDKVGPWLQGQLTSGITPAPGHQAALYRKRGDVVDFYLGKVRNDKRGTHNAGAELGTPPSGDGSWSPLGGEASFDVVSFTSDGAFSIRQAIKARGGVGPATGSSNVVSYAWRITGAG